MREGNEKERGGTCCEDLNLRTHNHILQFSHLKLTQMDILAFIFIILVLARLSRFIKNEF